MKNILVRAPNWIGDQVLAYPFFYYLRKAFPKAHITSVCVPWVADVQFRDLVDEVFVLSRPSRDTLWDRFSALENSARQLRFSHRKWDLAISLPNSFSAAWFLFRAGAEIRRGYVTDGRGILLNQKIQWNEDPSRHRAQAYVDLLPVQAKPLRQVKEFWGIFPANELDSGVSGELICFDAEKSWPYANPLEPPSQSYWVLAPGATAESRRWPEVEFVRLSRLVVNQTGWMGIVVGGPAESALSARLCADTSLKLMDWTAQGPITSLWKLFRQARFTVCNESGMAHIAALCGSQVQIICGAADPRRTQPLGPGRVQVSFNPVECWPCERNTCSQPPERQLQCLKGIYPDSVWQEIQNGIRS